MKSLLKHLKKHLKKTKKAPFKAGYVIDKQFKTLSYLKENTAYYVEYVDKYLSLYRSFKDDKVIGYILYDYIGAHPDGKNV